MLSRHGVAIVPQELSLLLETAPWRERAQRGRTGHRWFPSRRRMLDRTTELLTELDLDLDPNASVRTWTWPPSSSSWWPAPSPGAAAS
ncbi:hypothetical protein GCM10023238_32480 [Streptomyces heliomycini]